MDMALSMIDDLPSAKSVDGSATFAGLGSGSVLIVEDDDEVREAIDALLELEGFRVRMARNGQEALDLLHSMAAPPQVILLDLMMPVMNGVEFLAAARKDAALAHIPVVVMSAYSHLAEEVQDVAAYIKKPVDVGRLLETVRRYCH